MATTINEDVRINGTLTATSVSSSGASITGAMMSPNAEIGRSQMAQDTLAIYPINLMDLRVHDALNTVLPGTAAADDLALDSGTFGTEAAHLTAGDLKAAGATTRYARFLVVIPHEYDDAETLQLRVNAKMETTVADTTCTVDVEAYEIASDLTTGSDLCTTAAQSCNSLTAANLDFTLTATSVVSGDVLDVRVAIACNDAATGTVVEPVISKIALLADVRG
jgi:hypothetical protein